MVDASLRIRLEGRVEELERAVLDWAAALEATKKRRFIQAAKVLERGEVELKDHGDEGLVTLLVRQTTLRRAIERLVAKRLQTLGMPTIDRARGAAWLASEPVLYEHHCLRPIFIWRLPFLLAFLAASSLFVSRACVPIGVAGFLLLAWLSVKYFGWSDVALTPRRLVIEGQVIDLTDVKSIQVVRGFMEYAPERFTLEIRRKSGAYLTAKINYASERLRTALARLGINTGYDWGPY